MDPEIISTRRRPGESRGEKLKWATPFMKQCFVTLGVYLNMMAFGTILAFFNILVMETDLKDIETWHRYQFGVNYGSCVAGNFVNLGVMSRFGRRVAHMTNIIFIIIGWLVILFCDINISTIFVAEMLFGISMGMMISIAPVLIGEYTSPKNRGAFLAAISVAITMGILLTNALLYCVTYKPMAIIYGLTGFVNLWIVYNSPESPSFLADKKRFQECQRVFKWLRGDEENDELEKMKTKIQETMEIRYQPLPEENIRRGFYKPIILITTMYAMQQWTGNVHMMHYYHIFGYNNYSYNNYNNYNNYSLMIFLAPKLIFNIFSVFLIRTFKRRTVLFTAGGLNVFILLILALYTYFEFEHSFITRFLLHLHTLVSAGVSPLPFVLAGEVFPLRYRSLSIATATLFSYLNAYVIMRIGIWLLLNMWCTFILCAGMIGLCSAVAGLLLPETKDCTLQDIENKFQGRTRSPEEIHM